MSKSGKSCKNTSHFSHHKKGSVKVGKLVNLGNFQSSPSKMTCSKFWSSYLKVGNKLLTTSKPFEDQTTNQISAFHRYSRYGAFQPFPPKEYVSNPVFLQDICAVTAKQMFHKKFQLCCKWIEVLVKMIGKVGKM